MWDELQLLKYEMPMVKQMSWNNNYLHLSYEAKEITNLLQWEIKLKKCNYEFILSVFCFD